MNEISLLDVFLSLWVVATSACAFGVALNLPAFPREHRVNWRRSALVFVLLFPWSMVLALVVVLVRLEVTAPPMSEWILSPKDDDKNI